MGAIKKLNIELSDELAADVGAAVDSGDYADADEVIDEALRAWQRKRETVVSELRQLVQEGIGSGDAGPWSEVTAADIKRRGRAALAAKRTDG